MYGVEGSTAGYEEDKFSCCWLALLTNRAGKCCWWGSNNASGIWKEIMGYQAGADVLILPHKHRADPCFVIVRTHVWE